MGLSETDGEAKDTSEDLDAKSRSTPTLRTRSRRPVNAWMLWDSYPLRICLG